MAEQSKQIAQTPLPEIPGQTKALVKQAPDPKAALTKDGEAELIKIAVQLREAAPQIVRLEIESDEDEANLAACKKPLREARKVVKEQFAAVLKEPEGLVKALKARRKLWEDLLKKLDGIINQKTSAWLTARDEVSSQLRTTQKEIATAAAEKAREAMAQEAEERGDHAMARTIRSEPLGVALAPDPGPAKVEGARTAVDYVYEVTDWHKFLDYLRAQPAAVLAEAISLNDSWMKKRLRNYGDSIKVPGIKIERILKRKGSR